MNERKSQTFTDTFLMSRKIKDWPNISDRQQFMYPLTRKLRMCVSRRKLYEPKTSIKVNSDLLVF